MLAWGAAGIGVVVGLVLGAVLASRRASAVSRRAARIEAQVRNVILPVLERRAADLHVDGDRDGLLPDEPLERAVSLATRIERHDESVHLPYSDTLEVARAEVGAAKKQRAPTR